MTAAVRISYPRTEAYIAWLPAGLDSFRACHAKASIHRKVYEFSERPLVGLPCRLQELIDTPPPPSVRLNQCETLALILAMVEAQGLSGADESGWIRRAATHLFASPMYRVLMWAVTPRMVFKTANVRWSAFFKGTSLRSDVGEREALVHLEAPWGLFNEDLCQIFEDVMFAAVNYTKDESESASIELVRCDEGGIEYRGRW